MPRNNIVHGTDDIPDPYNIKTIHLPKYTFVLDDHLDGSGISGIYNNRAINSNFKMLAVNSPYASILVLTLSPGK